MGRNGVIWDFSEPVILEDRYPVNGLWICNDDYCIYLCVPPINFDLEQFPKYLESISAALRSATLGDCAISTERHEQL